MEFFGDAIIWISNHTIPIAYVLFIIGIIIAAIEGIGRIMRTKNEEKQKYLAPIVEKIKEKGLSEDEEYEELADLYKKNNYSSIRPMVFMVLGFVLYMIVFISFIGKNFDGMEMNYSASFFWINDIFIRNQPLMVTPMIIASLALKLLSIFVYRPKDLKTPRRELLNVATRACIFIVFAFLFQPSYYIFVVGHDLGLFFTSLRNNKLRREYYEIHKNDPKPEEVSMADEAEIIDEKTDAIDKIEAVDKIENINKDDETKTEITKE